LHPKHAGHGVTASKLQRQQSNSQWQDIVWHQYYEPTYSFRPILYFKQDLPCLDDFVDVTGKTLCMIDIMYSGVNVDRNAAAPHGAIHPQSCGSTKSTDFHLQADCPPRDIARIVELYRAVDRLEKDLAQACTTETRASAQSSINKTMAELGKLGCNEDIKLPAWLRTRILREQPNRRVLWELEKTHIEHHFCLGLLHILQLGLVKQLVLKWHSLGIRRSPGVTETFSTKPSGNQAHRAFMALRSQHPNLNVGASTRHPSFVSGGVKEQSVLSGSQLMSLVLPSAVSNVPSIVPNKERRRQMNRCLELSSVIYFLCQLEELDEGHKRMLFTCIDSFHSNLVKVYRIPPGPDFDARLLYSDSNLEFWKFHVFFCHVKAYINEHGTLSFSGDELLEIMIRRGKQLFTRTNGGGMDACTEQLGKRLVEYHVLRKLQQLCMELGAENEAIAAPGASPRPLPRFYMSNNTALEALATLEAFKVAFEKLNLGSFDKSVAQGFTSLTYERPSRFNREPAELKHSPRLNKLGRDIVVLTNEDGSPPLEALSTFDPSQCRVCSPLIFLSYSVGATTHMLAAMQPLQRHSNDSTWNEYMYCKPMTLVRGKVELVFIRHIYDRLRPLLHFVQSGSSCVPSDDTVHLTTYL